MQGQPNSRIVGATVIGFALVAGAFTLSNLQKTQQPVVQTATVGNAPALRVPIPVTDTSGDGIEDWREEFVTTKPVYLSQEESVEYTPPETLTGKIGIDLFEQAIMARNQGPFGSSDEEIVERAVSQLQQETPADKIYNAPDVIIIKNWDEEDIRNYANTVIATIIRHSAENERSEIDILYEYTRTNDPALLEEIADIATTYRNYREDTLKIPVPALLAKEHLDLINSYHALHGDISALATYGIDPAVALLRLKRYQDDVLGLTLSFENMYRAIEPYASVFQPNDSAMLLVQFSPDLQR